MVHDASVASVLVIEDDDRIRLSLVLALEDEGYAARGAATAEEGLRQQRATPADTVLVDLMLPGPRRFRVHPASCAATTTCRSWWSAPATTPTTSSPRWRPAPTTTWSSRWRSRNCRPGCARCAGAAGPATEAVARPWSFGDLRDPPEAGEVRLRGRTGRGDPHRVPAAVRAGRARRPGAVPPAAAANGSGSTTSATSGWSTCTSAGCGRRSKTTRRATRHLVTVRGLGYKLQR